VDDAEATNGTGHGEPADPTDDTRPMAAFAPDGRITWSNEAFTERFGPAGSLGDLRDLDRRRMQALLANIADTITLVDAEGTVLYTSGFHTDVLGYDADSWRGNSIIDLTHPDDLDQLLLLRRRVIDEPGTEFRAETRVRDASGGFQFVELAAVNLLDDPAVRGVVITTRNVSARKEIERELARRRDEAVEESRVRAEFVARVSHELRNQVHALHGLTELLGRSEVPASARELAAAAQRQAEQFEFLVNDLLEYSRLNATGQTTDVQPCALRQLVADVRSAIVALARSGVQVRGEVDDEVPEVVATDEARLRQVLLNLGGNAAKFTHDGSIVVGVELRSPDTLAVTVTDSGVGMDAGDLERIFTPFEHAGSAGAQRGAGLGLAISQRATELLGGRIEVDSELGRGSAFTVLLPCRPLDPGVVARTTTTRAEGTLDVTVLVVEDNPVVMKAMSKVLAGYEGRLEAIFARDAAEALLKCSESEPDLVITDLIMEPFDGFHLIRVLRNSERFSRLTILVVTGITLKEIEARGGLADDVIVYRKPLSAERLGGFLDAFLQQRARRG